MGERLPKEKCEVLPHFFQKPLLLGIALSGSVLAAAPVEELIKSSDYCSIYRVTTSDGQQLTKTVIRGPATPPAGFALQRQAVALPTPSRFGSSNSLTVPAFKWVLGCSAVSGAMIAGYYDRNGYPNMYTGPTNSGVMPLDSSSWSTWSDGYTTYPNCPLIASHNGVDGRTIKGTLDDYWVQYEGTTVDPYITGGWSQHVWSSAIGDFMKTSQSAYSNVDGSTTFWNYTSLATPLTASAMEGYGIASSDGSYGRKLFYEARGYTVSTCYNQVTDNQVAGGFSFAQFKAEIDAGRPVMLNLVGHTVVGVGYEDTGSVVYIHDTWDYSTHSMTWGGSYTDMALQSVSIVNLAAIPSSPALVSFYPTSGRVGDAVTLSGTGFTGTTAVSFNGVSASFTVDSDSQITVAVPAGVTTGKVTVTTSAGTAQSSSNFTLIAYDLNGDGTIDLKDLARIALYFLTYRADGVSAFQAQYDLNGDGVIDEVDASILMNHLD